jgi:tetratricopeptide (TPR) repeat protein
MSEMNTHRENRTESLTGTWGMAAVVVVMLALRMAVILPLSGTPLMLHPVLEDADYQNRVIEIREGTFLEAKLPRGSVLYPHLAALVPGVERGGCRAIGIAQGIIEAGTALLLMLWMRRRWGLLPAVLGGLLYALDPVGATFAARFSPVTLAVLFFVLAVWLLDRELSEPKPSLGRAASTGAAAAVGFLLVPLPFMILLLLRTGRLLTAPSAGSNPTGSREGRPWLRALLPLVLLLVPAGLVTVQHSTIAGGGAVLGWGGGPAMYNAFDPASGGTPRCLRPPSWAGQDQLMTRAWEALGREGTLLDLHRYFATQGVQHVIERPLATVGVLLTKAGGTLGAFPIPDSLSPAFLLKRYAPFFGYGGYSYALLLALGLAGLLLLGRDSARDAALMGLLAVGASALFGMASAASRQPALPLLAALGGVWIARALGRDAGARRKSLRGKPALVLIGAVALSLALGSFSPTAALRNPSEDLRLVAGVMSGARSLDQAVPLLEEAVRDNPRNVEARAQLAQAYQMDGLTEPAMQQLESAFRADSTNAATLYFMADLYQRRGESDRAMAMLIRLVNLHPNNPLYLNQLGNMLLVRGLYPQATQMFSRALQLKPDYEVARQNLVTTETYRQRMEDALFPPEQRLPRDDPFDAALPHLMEAMETLNWATADSILTWGERTRPGALEPLWFRAAYYARKGDTGLSLATLERCNRLAPGRPMIVQQLAEAYLRDGQQSKLGELFGQSMAAADGDTVRVGAILRLRDAMLKH